MLKNSIQAFLGILPILFSLVAQAQNSTKEHVKLVAVYKDAPGFGFFDNSSSPVGQPGPTIGDARQAAFQSALDIWHNLLVAKYPGETINISASWQKQFGNNATGGPTDVEANFGSNDPKYLTNTYYGRPLVNHLAGFDTNGQNSGSIVFSTDASWDYSLVSGLKPGNNMVAVSVHEIGHILGFTSGLDGNGIYLFSDNFPEIYDRFHTLGINGPYLTTLSESDRAAAIKTDNIYFDGLATRALNGGQPAKLYGSNGVFLFGISLVHLGIYESVIYPIISFPYQYPDPIMLGVLQDLGWEIERTSVTGLSLNATAVNLRVGESQQLIATLTPSNADNPTVTWGTSDSQIARVSQGLVTAAFQGTATITATTQDGGFVAWAVVTVKPEIAPENIFTTQTPFMEYTDNVPYEIGIKFKSAVAGNIRAIRYWKAPSETGTHTGTLWSASGTKLASVTFSYETASGWQVANLNTPVPITADTTYLASVNTNTYFVTTNNALGSSVVNGNLSTIADGNNGVFGAIGTFPTSSYVNSNYFRDVVFIETTPTQDSQAPSAPTDLNSVNVDQASLTLNWTAATDNVGVTGYDVYNGTVKLNTANITGTSFNVTGLNPGTSYSFTVTAKDAAGNVSAASVPITVTTAIVAVTGVSVSPATLSLAVAGTQQLTPTVNPLTATNKLVTWVSSDNAVATVSTSGLVTAIEVGTATITVTTVDGSKTAISTITVTASSGSSNIAGIGTGYRWFNNTSSTDNTNMVAATAINDGSTTTDVDLSGGNSENGNAWEAVGIIWTDAKSNITSVNFTNGSFTSGDDGSFGASLKLQSSTDGTTWTDVSGWTLTPSYSYNASNGGTKFTFNVAALSNIKGIRITGQVHTAQISSYQVNVREVEVWTGGSTSSTASTVFTTQLPTGSDSDQPYELGMKFKSSQEGNITNIRYYKMTGESGTHTGRIWSSGGTQLASATFSDETATGWQEATLATPLSVTANTTYVVSVNNNNVYAATNDGLQTSIINGPLSSIADGANGVYNTTPGSFPNSSYRSSNYFRDVVFTSTQIARLSTKAQKLSPEKVKDVTNDILVYPNPTTGGFQIEFANEGQAEVIITNTSGQSVVNFKRNGNVNEKIDLSNHGGGLYMLRVQNGKGIRTKKMVLGK